MMAKHEKPLHLDIDFNEALNRYIGTDPRELAEPTKPMRQKERRKRLRSNQPSPQRVDKSDSTP